MLFATLDPTSRAIKLPHGENAILSDTVGFISDLPTMLVAAFRATLEDVIEADVLLHVRDISHGETEAEATDVQRVLRDLGINPEDRHRVVEVWNKADLLAPDERERLAATVERMPADERPVLVSAITGDGLERLLRAVELRIAKGRPSFQVILDPADGQGLNWLYEQGEVLDRRTDADGRLHLVVRIAPEKEPRLRGRFPVARRIS
jgi:GTP-binding protein HflX